MWRYTNVPSTVEDAGKKEKGQSVSLLCLEGLLRVFTTMLQRYPTRMSNFLSSLGGPLNTHFYIILMYVYGVLINKKKTVLKMFQGKERQRVKGLIWPSKRLSTSASFRYQLHFQSVHLSKTHWQILYIFFSVQRALMNQLSGGEEEFNSKEAQLLVSILSVLSRHLNPSSQQVVLQNTHAFSVLAVRNLNVAFVFVFYAVCTNDHLDTENL